MPLTPWKVGDRVRNLTSCADLFFDSPWGAKLKIPREGTVVELPWFIRHEGRGTLLIEWDSLNGPKRKAENWRVWMHSDFVRRIDGERKAPARAPSKPPKASTGNLTKEQITDMVACPTCGKRAGNPCSIGEDGRPKNHFARMQDAQAMQAERVASWTPKPEPDDEDDFDLIEDWR